VIVSPRSKYWGTCPRATAIDVLDSDMYNRCWKVCAYPAGFAVRRGEASAFSWFLVLPVDDCGAVWMDDWSIVTGSSSPARAISISALYTEWR